MTPARRAFDFPSELTNLLPVILMTGILLMGSTGGDVAAQDESAGAPPPCSSPEANQFDFWIGTWDLKWEGGSGTNTITKIMSSCVVQEQFDGGEFEGMSVSVYLPSAERWKQTWVDNQGGYLDFIGGMDGERMILAREDTLQTPPIRQRMVFSDITPDSLDWDWEISEDGGHTWNLKWRIHYRRRN